MNICGSCGKYIEENLREIELSEKIRRRFRELMQFDIVLSGSIICSSCDSKITEFKKFKNEITEAQKRLDKHWKGNSDDNRDLSPSKTDHKDQQIIKSELKVEKDHESSKKCNRTKSTADSHYCRFCNKYFTETRKVPLHIARIHCKRKDFQCDLCPYKAFKKYDLALHFNNIHKPKDLIVKTSICPMCGLPFSSNSRLNIHIRRKHSQETVRKLCCDLCDHRATVLNEIRRHVNTHLPKELKQSFPCVDCGAILSSKGSLKIHRDSKHDMKVPSIICFCGKSFRQKSVYSRHYQVLHKGIKAFKCKFCGKDFSGKSHLNYHVKALHSVSTMITCEICGNRYKNEDTLKKHLIYHANPKFECTVCRRKFHENKKLLDHMSAHEKLQFSCQHCTRSFRLESQLRYHNKKVHFKDKTTFKCELCSSTFTRKSTYRDHALRQHKELEKESMTQLLEKIKNAVPEEHQKH